MHFTVDKSAQTEPRFHASYSKRKTSHRFPVCLEFFLSLKHRGKTKQQKPNQKSKPQKQPKPNETKTSHHQETQPTTQNKTNHQTQQLCNAPSGTLLSPEATFCSEELEDWIFSIWNREGITFLFNTITQSRVATGFSSTWNISKLSATLLVTTLKKKLPAYSKVPFYPSSQQDCFKQMAITQLSKQYPRATSLLYRLQHIIIYLLSAESTVMITEHSFKAFELQQDVIHQSNQRQFR